MTTPYRRATGLVAALVFAWPSVLAGQAGADSSRLIRLRVTGGLGFTLIHLPAFTYTRGAQRTPVTEGAQEGGGPAFTGSLEAQRGRHYAGARYQLVVAPLSTDWYAHVAAVYAGVARRRPVSVLSAALGATVVHREQVTSSFAPGLCLFAGCESAFRVNRDGGTITTSGLLLTVAAERRFGRLLGVGAEGFAATGRQRYAGAMLRVSISQR